MDIKIPKSDTEPLRTTITKFTKSANSDDVKEKSVAKRNKSFRIHPDILEALERTAREELKSFAEVHRDVLIVGMRMRGIEIKPKK